VVFHFDGLFLQDACQNLPAGSIFFNILFFQAFFHVYVSAEMLNGVRKVQDIVPDGLPLTDA